MPKIVKNEVLVGSDGKLYQLCKNHCCSGCIIKKYRSEEDLCEDILNRLFKYKKYIDYDCHFLIGPNKENEFSFKILDEGI